MIKTPRDAYPTLRAALTLLTIFPKQKILTTTTVLSVHGCARTAKYHAIREIRKRHEQCIWNVLEPYFPPPSTDDDDNNNHNDNDNDNDNDNMKEDKDLGDNDENSDENAKASKQKRQSMKARRRILSRQKQHLFQKLLTKHQSQFKEQYIMIQNLD